MRKRTLYLCGAGNGEGVRLAVRTNEREDRWDRIVLLDDDPAKQGQAILGVPIVGPFDTLENVAPDRGEVVNLVTRTTVRRWAARCRIEAYGVPFATLIDRSVDVSGVEYRRDFMAYPNANVGPAVFADEGSAVLVGAAVGHGSRLGRCCVVAPNAVVNARVTLGDGVYVGTNAAILPDVKISPWATIAACTLVVGNVPAGATVMGVPSKVVLRLRDKLRMRGGEALPPDVRRELEVRFLTRTARAVSVSSSAE